MVLLGTGPVATFDPAKDLRVLREPAVYLVGRQRVDQEAVDRFLADHGVSWQTDTEVGGQALCEIAGRVCYMSFARPRPGGNKAYLDHILEVAHGSVLEHACWNLLFTGISRSCSHELVRHRAGWAYCLTGDTLVYSEHLIGGKRDGATKRRLDDLFAMTKTSHGRSRLKLLRLRCLDEVTRTFTTGKVAQVVASGRKPVFRVELEDGKSITCSRDHRFLSPRGWLPLHEVVGGLTVSVGGLAVHGPLATPIATNGIPAYKDREWLRQHYVEQGLEQEARFGAPPSEVRAIDPGTKPQGGGNVLAPQFRRIRSVSYAGEQDTYDIEMEGPHHNFVANGIVTHNSQLSQRYVDESVAEYVEPDVIADDPELHALWLDAVARAHRAYVELVEKLGERFKDEPDRTLRRKLARQAARSVLPNATETKIFVTANARALRHFIEMRASRHAETEIRKLAVKVLEVMKQEAPGLFADYQLVPLPDGTFEASTPHRKV
jgi:thymidylate synthase (FAD)